jgi:hypothetical protein
MGVSGTWVVWVAAAARRASRSNSADTPRISTAQLADKEAWREFQAVVVQMSPSNKLSPEEMGGCCDQLLSLLNKKKPVVWLSRDGRRNSVLRSLVQFTDSDATEPRVQLKVLRVILQVDRKGSMLRNVCKLIFKLSEWLCFHRLYSEPLSLQRAFSFPLFSLLFLLASRFPASLHSSFMFLGLVG